MRETNVKRISFFLEMLMLYEVNMWTLFLEWVNSSIWKFHIEEGEGRGEQFF